MNYQALKWLIDNLIKEYKCPNCSKDVKESNVDIIWAAGTTINIDIWCPACNKHSMIKSEILSIDISKLAIAKEWLSQIRNKLEEVKWKLIETKKKNQIKDKEIIDLDKKLKTETLNVEDLLW